MTILKTSQFPMSLIASKRVDEVITLGDLSKEILCLHRLFISEAVLRFIGMDMSIAIAVDGAPKDILLAEPDQPVIDAEVFQYYQDRMTFSPGQFWLVFAKLVFYELEQVKKHGTCLGEDLRGVVFMVEKNQQLKALNFYREETEEGKDPHFCLRMFDPNSLWEAGHSFVIKV